MQKKALGKGLRALIPEGSALDPGRVVSPVARMDPAAAAEAGKASEIEIGLIRMNPLQPRRQVDQRRLEGLAQSIRESGVIEPVVLRAAPDGTFEVVAGSRRIAASKMAGLKSVPAVVRETSRREMLELALVENLQREDLNPLEEAEAYARLQEEFGLSQDQIASRVGKDRSTVSNAMRLLALPDDVRAHVSRGTLSAGHARAILGVDSALEQSVVARSVVERGLSVRQLEELVRRRARRQRGRARARGRSPVVEDLETRLQQWLAAPCRIQMRGRKGRIEIQFFSEEDLERILERIGILQKR
jgi:ParB family chromosome partitioning protein